MPRFPEHLTGPGPNNPFPGIKVLERRIGREIPHRLGSNEGLDMPHQALRERFGDAMVEHVYGYGDSEALGIRQRLASLYGLPLEATLVDAGADSLIALALRCVAEAGCTVVSASGTYPTFGYFAQAQGCHLVECPYREAPGLLAPDFDALLASTHEYQARLVYVANPDNPSGHLHSDDEIRQLRAALPEDCWLLLDEAYHDFRDDADSAFGREVLPGVIRLRTLSKAHGLAGLRVGYAVAEPETLAMMMKVRIHYAVSTLSQAVAEAVLDQHDEVTKHIADVKQRREALAQYFQQLGAEVLPSATNFIALRLPCAELAGRLNEELLAAGILIARPAHPDLGHILRITAVADALQPGRFALLEQALKHA